MKAESAASALEGTGTKAFIWTRYGPPEGLQLREVPRPVPRRGEVLVRVRATTVSAGDAELRRFQIPSLLWLPLRLYMGFFRPRGRILGQEFSGEVESVGDDVVRFRPRDKVFGTTGLRFGAYAEFVTLPAQSNDAVLSVKPAGVTHEEAAAVPTGGLEALHLLRKGGVGVGKSILIIGAGGSIGTFAVQLARHYGAMPTALDRPEKLEFLRSIGAVHVTDSIPGVSGATGPAFDLVLDVTGKIPYSRMMRWLRPGGRCLLANPRLSDILRARLTTRARRRRVVLGPSKERPKELEVLRGLIESGFIHSIIDRRYPFEQIPEAHRYVDTGQKKGNVVISFEHSRGSQSCS